MNRWRVALNAFAVTFEGRITPTENQECQRARDLESGNPEINSRAGRMGARSQHWSYRVVPIRRMDAPIRVNFEITEACNLACVHCYHYASAAATGVKLRKDPRELSLEHFSTLLDAVLARGVRVITFTGGEPFLRKEILFPLAAQAKAANARVLINTNGMLVSDSDASELATIGVDGFLVSLMSSDSAINDLLSGGPSYQRTMNGIRALVAHGHRVTVNMVCSKINFRDLRSTATAMADMGVTGFSASPMLPAHETPSHLAIHLSREEAEQVMEDLLWAREHLPIEVKTLDALAYCAFSEEKRKKLLPLLDERYCCAGTSDCAISPEGNLRACVMSDESGGNVLRDGWAQSWSGLAHWAEPEILPPECLECDLVDHCGGGCRTAAKAMTGSLSGRDPYMVGPIHSGSHGAVGDRTAEMKSQPILERDEALTASTDLLVRREPFGASVFTGAKATFINEDGADFLETAISSEKFTVASLVATTGYEEYDVTYFLQVFVDDGFLQRVRTGIERG